MTNPARPALSLDIPLSMMGLSRSRRDGVCSEAARTLEGTVGKLQLVNALMRFHDEAQRLPGLKGVFLEKEDGGLRVQVSFLTPEGVEEWVDVKDGEVSPEDIRANAQAVGVELEDGDEEKILDAAAELFWLKDNQQALDAVSQVCAHMGTSEFLLSREQVANPSSLVFFEHAGAIQAFEAATVMEQELPQPGPSRSSSAPRF